MKSIKGYFYIVGATMFWGLSAVIAKVLFNRQVDPLILVQTRVTLSAVTMLAFFVLFKRTALRIQLRDVLRFLLLGIIGIAGSNFTYYFTIQQINVSTAILIQYTAPLLVLAYATVSKEEALSAIKIAAGFVSVAGCFMAVGGKVFSFADVSGLGLLSGVGSALCWAFTNVYVRRLLHRYNVWTVLVYSFLAASCFWLFFNPPWRVLAENYPLDAWLQFLGFSMISVLIPHSLYFTGVQYVTASRAIITGTFEPIVAIAGSYFILGDILAPIQLVGALVVVGAIALLQTKREESEVLVSQRKTEKNPT